MTYNITLENGSALRTENGGYLVLENWQPPPGGGSVGRELWWAPLPKPQLDDDEALILLMDF